eukprot:SAG11_NODE_924_length_6525_cov_5.604264_1_plen_270_part_00
MSTAAKGTSGKSAPAAASLAALFPGLDPEQYDAALLVTGGDCNEAYELLANAEADEQHAAASPRKMSKKPGRSQQPKRKNTRDIHGAPHEAEGATAMEASGSAAVITVQKSPAKRQKTRDAVEQTPLSTVDSASTAPQEPSSPESTAVVPSCSGKAPAGAAAAAAHPAATSAAPTTAPAAAVPMIAAAAAAAAVSTVEASAEAAAAGGIVGRGPPCVEWSAAHENLWKNPKTAAKEPATLQDAVACAHPPAAMCRRAVQLSSALELVRA